jgi:ABC-2 type transport system permease protein
MNTFKWLVKRELWEHRGALVIAPIVVAILMVVFITATLIITTNTGEKSLVVNGVSISSIANVLESNKVKVAESLSMGYLNFAMPAFYTAAFCVFFFCLGALYDDRRDRSVFFWKSLPISDTQTVLSKFAVAIIVAPLFAVIIGLLSALLITVTLLIVAAFYGVNLVGSFLSNADTYLTPIKFLALWPIYALWALPTIGWLMLVSAWARSKPFLWAVGVPLVLGLLVTWTNRLFSLNWNDQYLWKEYIFRLFGSLIPGSWIVQLDRRPLIANYESRQSILTLLFDQSWQLLLSPNIWIGAVLGVAMLAGAIWLRSHRDEI